jgi:hypothetical protein
VRVGGFACSDVADNNKDIAMVKGFLLCWAVLLLASLPIVVAQVVDELPTATVDVVLHPLAGQITNEQLDQIVSKAAAKSWEAAALCGLMAIVVVAFVWLMKFVLGQAGDREHRMAKRIDELETWVKDELKELAINATKAFERNSTALDKLTESLTIRPCFWDELHRDKLVKALAEKIPEAFEKKP